MLTQRYLRRYPRAIISQAWERLEWTAQDIRFELDLMGPAAATLPADVVMDHHVLKARLAEAMALVRRAELILTEPLPSEAADGARVSRFD